MLLFSCVSTEDEGEGEKLRVLFLGNSYTFNNDLPGQVAEMFSGRNRGASIEVKSMTPGGAKVEDHLGSSFTLDTIRNGNWDVVVIQGHSLEPLKAPDGFRDAVAALADIAEEAGADVFLFETWARAAGASEYSEGWSGMNPDEMQNRISKAYNEAADFADARVIPVGSVWRRLSIDSPEIELYSTDGSHPSISGSYLAACVIYKYLFNADPAELAYVPDGLKKSEAKMLRYAAGQ